MINMLFLLLGWHALADFPLQGDYMAKAKDPTNDPTWGVWPWVLSSHCMVHAVGVLVITGSTGLATAELMIHGIIDLAKCQKRISFGVDQALHVLCKVAYVGWLAW